MSDVVLERPKGGHKNCRVRGKFVDPCWVLQAALEPTMQFGRPSRGISFRNNLINIKTGKKTRSYVEIYSGEFRKRGIIANYCPFCAKPISAHLFKKRTRRP